MNGTEKQISFSFTKENFKAELKKALEKEFGFCGGVNVAVAESLIFHGTFVQCNVMKSISDDEVYTAYFQNFNGELSRNHDFYPVGYVPDARTPRFYGVGYGIVDSHGKNV